MHDYYRDVLTSLRCDANMLRDIACSGAKDTAIRMIDSIDVALMIPIEVKPSQAIDAIPSWVLLDELRRRMRVDRHTKKICTQCKNEPSRAHGLCMKCYKKERRKGKFGAVVREKLTPVDRIIRAKMSFKSLERNGR